MSYIANVAPGYQVYSPDGKRKWATSVALNGVTVDLEFNGTYEPVCRISNPLRQDKKWCVASSAVTPVTPPPDDNNITHVIKIYPDGRIAVDDGQPY